MTLRFKNFDLINFIIFPEFLISSSEQKIFSQQIQNQVNILSLRKISRSENLIRKIQRRYFLNQEMNTREEKKCIRNGFQGIITPTLSGCENFKWCTLNLLSSKFIKEYKSRVSQKKPNYNLRRNHSLQMNLIFV